MLENNPSYQRILDFIAENNVERKKVVNSFKNENAEYIISRLEKSGYIFEDKGGILNINPSAFLDLKVFSERYCTDAIADKIDRNLSELYLNDRENEIQHSAFDKELLFYESIKSGNIDTVKLLYTPLGGKGYGVLSNDNLQNLKYHLVITIAMVTRYCVSGGLPMEYAYHLSDIFIVDTDRCKSETEVQKLHYNVLVRFTQEMHNLLSRNKYSVHVMKTIDYISDHLHEDIGIIDAAENVSLSVPYLSKLFKKETGVTFSEYICIKKVESAQKMLQYSNMSALEISTTLNFSSQSYFIKVFRKHTGMTPKEFKHRFYNDNGMFTANLR